MLRFLSVAAVCLLFTGSALAGPEDASKFDGTPYAAQKALYDFNYADPIDGKWALGYIRNHLRALKEFGDAPGSHIVIVAHGNELHAFSRHNREAYPEVYQALKALTDTGASLSRPRDAELGYFGHIALATRPFSPQSSSSSRAVSALTCSSSCFAGKMVRATFFPVYEFVT